MIKSGYVYVFLFFSFQGPGIKAGYQIRGDVRDRDITPTVAWSLGIKQSPYWYGDVVYEIFEENSGRK